MTSMLFTYLLISAAVLLLLILALIAYALYHALKKLNRVERRLGRVRARQNSKRSTQPNKLSRKLAEYERRLSDNKSKLRAHGEDIKKLKGAFASISQSGKHNSFQAKRTHGRTTYEALESESQREYRRGPLSEREQSAVDKVRKLTEQEDNNSSKREEWAGKEQETQAPQPRYSNRLAEKYNRSLRGNTGRKEFDSIEYFRVGVLNSEERVHDPSIAPIFGEESNGDYWVVEESEEDGTALAMPRLNLVIEDAQRETGAMDQVFQCEGPGHGKPYEVAHLESPARLSKKRDDSWQLERQGKIELTRYD